MAATSGQHGLQASLELAISPCVGVFQAGPVLQVPPTVRYHDQTFQGRGRESESDRDRVRVCVLSSSGD